MTATGVDATGEVELTILMPCLNEARTLPACLRKARSFLERTGIAGEIVVADNGSTDGSQALAREMGARVVDVPVRGYGAALFHGAHAARGRYVIMGDSDDSYDFSALDDFVARLRAGDELVMGNRFRGRIMPGAMPWKNRYLGNPVLTGIGRVFFRCPIGDFHCGQRGFSRAAFLRMDLRTTGMEFASEMVIKATLLSMRMSEVPITLHKDGRDRPPHLNPWRDGWRHLRFMLLYSPRWLFFYPGLALTLAGLVLGMLLVRGPLQVAGLFLDVHTLLYAAAAVEIGFQAMLFSLLARVHALSEGLLPSDPMLERTTRHVTLEGGLAVGVAVLLVGLALTLLAVGDWRARGFGSLDYTVTLRVAIPAVVSLTLGGEIVLGSFLFSVLGLRKQR